MKATVRKEEPKADDVELRLRKELAIAKQWYDEATGGGMRLGGGPFNTEGMRLLLAAFIRKAEIELDGIAKTEYPSKHHA